MTSGQVPWGSTHPYPVRWLSPSCCVPPVWGHKYILLSVLLLGSPANERPLETGWVSSDPRDTVGKQTFLHEVWVGGGAGKGLLPDQKLSESSRERSPLEVHLEKELSAVTRNPSTGRREKLLGDARQVSPENDSPSIPKLRARVWNVAPHRPCERSKSFSHGGQWRQNSTLWKLSELWKLRLDTQWDSISGCYCWCN